jgi:hypothetical protein
VYRIKELKTRPSPDILALEPLLKRKSLSECLLYITIPLIAAFIHYKNVDAIKE